MQVNKFTFPAVFPHFKKLLQNCDFYAIDEEMTGISFGEGEENVTFSPAELYESKRPAASHFSLIQVGISLFHKVTSPSENLSEKSSTPKGGVPTRATYEARPFNFVLFPDYSRKIAYQASGPDGEGKKKEVQAYAKEVALSPSAAQFHRRWGMDFQSWVYEGISYCNGLQRAQWEKYLEETELQEKKKQAGVASVLPEGFTLSDAEEKWVNESLEVGKKMQMELLKYEEQLRLEEEKMNANVSHSSTGTAVSSNTEENDGVSSPPALEKESRIPSQTSRLAQEQLIALLRTEAPNVTLGSAKSGSCWLTVLTTEEKKREEKSKVIAKEREYYNLFGFQLVFEALVQSRKPCVGHNCFLDFLFLMASMDQPLSSTLLEWKHRVHELFPRIYDTKYLSTRSPLCSGDLFQPNYLAGLFKGYGLDTDHVKIVLPLGFGAYDSITVSVESESPIAKNNHEHEAGYDALMTGAVFANLIHSNGFSGVQDLPENVVNRIALFASLFSVVLTQEEDEYIPKDFSAISLESDQQMEYRHFVSCLNQVGLKNPSVFFVNDRHLLSLIPPSVKEDMILTKLKENFKKLRVSKYSPPSAKVSVLRPKIRPIRFRRL